MNSHQQNQQYPIIKDCIVCGEKESSDRKLMQLFTNRQWICLECYAQQNQMIVDYKKNKPTLYPDYTEILPSLYLGNQDSAMDQNVMHTNMIEAICVCGSFLLTPFEDSDFSKQKIPYKMHYYKLNIADYPSQKLLHLFPEATEWIHEHIQNKRNVLVHCAAGVSRSASFTIAYLMRYHKLRFTEAYNLVKIKRKIIRPNSGFINQLKQYEKILMESTYNQKQEVNVVHKQESIQQDK